MQAGGDDQQILQWCGPCLLRVMRVEDIVRVFHALMLSKSVVFLGREVGVVTSTVYKHSALIQVE